MKFLVIGCGSIGKRHIRNLKFLNAGEIIAHDVRPERCLEVEREYNIQAYPRLEDALEQGPAVALICNPSSLHISSALSAAEAGCNLFIEKPLSHSIDSVDRLIEVVAQKRLVALVGCNMRFHRGVSLMKELLDKQEIGGVLAARVQAGFYLPDWHPTEDYRKSYSASKSLGGGAVLDGIHELDYIMWFLGGVRQVFSFAGKLSDLEVDVEDTAEILLKFETGTIAEVHLDFIQRVRGRSCQLIGETGTIIWDQKEAGVRLYSVEDGYWRFYPEPFDYSINEMYVREMQHFIKCVKGEERLIKDLRQAKSVLAVALAAKESARTGRVVEV